jgi:hypothetical protein
MAGSVVETRYEPDRLVPDAFWLFVRVAGRLTRKYIPPTGPAR